MSEPTGESRAPLPVGAYVASALAAANYGGDSGEDVDRFLNELGARGYAVVPLDLLNRTARGLHAASHRGDFDICGVLICHDARKALL